MEIKSVSDCLIFIDSMILCSIQKHVGIGNLEHIHDYMKGMYIDNYIEEMVIIFAIPSQINLLLDRFYLDEESDIKKHYYTLKKHILAWLQERNTKTEVDNDE